MYATFTFFCCVIAYTVFRLFYPPKEKVIEECYQYVLEERNKFKRTYEFMPRNIEKRFQRQIRGVTKYNSRKIAEAVIQRLIDNNVVELVPDLCVDRYRAIYVEQPRSSSTIVKNESNS
jgi:hypothetical protein